MNTRELFGIFAKGLNINKKEVKRMSRPYLEVKVVPVKKEEKEKHYCKMCGSEVEMEKPNGNWVNGENLDEIKFPAPCRYGGGMLGMITRTKANESMDEDFYTLHDIGKQHSSYSSVRSYYNFRDLIEVWDIHILKAKIILFEEKNK